MQPEESFDAYLRCNAMIYVTYQILQRASYSSNNDFRINGDGK
jgi:hypothetical protein